MIPVRPKEEPCFNCPIDSKCCSRGVEVRPAQVRLIETLPLPFAKPWFSTRAVDWGDGSGEHFGTVVTDRGCVFLTADNKCGIHRFCLENNLDVKKYKPVDCVSFPFLPDGEEGLSEFYKPLCGIYFGEKSESEKSSTISRLPAGRQGRNGFVAKTTPTA